MDVAEHFELPAFDPALHGEILDAAAGYGAGIVDEDVDVGEALHGALTGGTLRKVGSVGLDLDLMARADLVGRLLQRFGSSRDEDDVGAFGRKGMAARRADALRATGNENLLVFETEIHGRLLLIDCFMGMECA